MSRKTFFAIASLFLLGVGSPYVLDRASTDEEPIKVDLLHSFTGTMKDSETSVADAVTLAIEEINDAGGCSEGASTSSGPMAAPTKPSSLERPSA